MEFRVLGPVGIWRDGRLLSVVGQKQRTLLAVLVLDANRVVSHNRLLVSLWGSVDPASGRRLLHNHLWSLRRLLTDPSALVGTPMGYSLQISSSASDLGVFMAEADAARVSLAAGDAGRAAEQFRKALALWRGPALAGTRPEFQSAEGHVLEERRAVVLAERIEADLALGRSSELIGELRQLVAENPLRERLRGQLMLALYRAGRTAEALEAYRLAHQHFRGELGLEPGEDLARLHQAILSADPGLNLDTEVRSAETLVSPAASPTRLVSVPRQLPSDVARFTGREESLKQLDLLLSAGQESASAVVITAIAGAAGVGKTALATRWGHRVADRFPDGQLYVNLHGYSQKETITGAQALRQLLGGLGVAADEVPHEVGERETLYRSLMAGKRILVVLDNAAKPEQVRPLLPGSSSCKVVITSRDSLRGLWATHDVRSIVLDVLSAEEAQALLVAILGIERVRDEMNAVSQLAQLCGYLPLALRLATAHLAGQPTLSIDDFVAKLRQESPLVALEIEEDPHIGVRAAFELSYQALPEVVRRTFRLMSLAPGPDISLDGIIALTGLPLKQARVVTDTLVNAHLVNRGNDQRLAMHDLVRSYARDRSELDDFSDDRHDALTRLFDWYLRTAVGAMDCIQPGRLTKLLAILLTNDEEEKFKDPDEAWGWLKDEHRSLIPMVSYCASNGWLTHAWKTARALSRFFDVHDRVDDWIATSQIGLTAVRALGDQRGEAEMSGVLGYAYMFAGNYPEYLDLQRRALALHRVSGNREGEAEALRGIGYGLTRIGKLDQAIEICQQSIELERVLGKRPSPSGALYCLSIVHLQMGRPVEALQGLSECHSYVKESGDRQNEAYILIYLGEAHVSLGNFALAFNCHLEALEIGQKTGRLRLVADVFNCLGRSCFRQGRLSEALGHHEKAMIQVRELRARELECETLVDLGNVYLAAGDNDGAIERYQAALDLSTSDEHIFLKGRAHKGLAEALDSWGREEESKIHLKEALAIFAPMGVPEADAVAAKLALS